MAWNAEVGGRQKAAFWPSGAITVGTGRRVGGWMGVMAMPQLPSSLLLW